MYRLLFGVFSLDTQPVVRGANGIATKRLGAEKKGWIFIFKSMSHVTWLYVSVIISLFCKCHTAGYDLFLLITLL